MGKDTKIEYCDATVNPIMGCNGCELFRFELARNHCYAYALSSRYAGKKGWPASFTKPEHFPGRIEEALRWSDLTGTERQNKPWLNGLPRIIFLNDLGDGFAPSVNPRTWLEPYIERMAASPHIWLFLTKWPERMAGYFLDWCHRNYCSVPSNFVLGTTVTSMDTIERVHDLLQIRDYATILWVSAEPLLGTVAHPLLSDVDWIAAGGESGHNARPCFIENLQALTRWYAPLFIKQLGARPMTVDTQAAWLAWGNENKPLIVDRRIFLKSTKGNDVSEWPEWLNVRQIPDFRR